MDTTTNLKLNKPAPEDFYDVADFNENADKIDSEFIKTLRKKKVTELPSTTKEYTFESSTEFTAVERCTLGLVTEGSDKFLRVTTASNSGNKYALAQLNFADIGQTADSFVINIDTRMPSSRWYISAVDLSKRPGESDKISYDSAGVAFSCGTKDGANFNVNNTDVFGNAFANAWLRIRLAVDVTGKTVEYEIKNRSNDTVLASGTVSFRDSGTDKITGIELYSYTQTTIDVDNIKVTAGYEIEENVIYCVGSGEVYDTYVYFDGEPVCLSSQTSTQLLKENSHTHSNKNVLDEISSSDISNWNSKANVSVLSGADVLTLSPGIYQIKDDCTNLPDDIGSVSAGITLIITPKASYYGTGNHYNMYLFANYVADDTHYVDNTKIWSCQVYVSDNTPSYDMPWVLIYSSIKQYKDIPVQIGTWIDGTPIWRCFTDVSSNHDGICRFNLHTKTVTNNLKVLEIKLRATTSNPNPNTDADISSLVEFKDNYSYNMYGRIEYQLSEGEEKIYGYCVFATPIDNIIQ